MPLVYSVASLVELEEVGAQVQISRRGYFQFFFSIFFLRRIVTLWLVSVYSYS